MRIHHFFITALAVALSACSGGSSRGGGIGMPPPQTSPPPASKISHVVIIFQENRTPDNLFHGLPGADIANSGLNSHGQTVPLVPVHLSGLQSPYDVDHSHRLAFVNEYNNGQMNGFDLVRINCPSDACVNPTAYGYVPPSEVAPYFTMAQRYVFADRMFQTNEGPSLPAHQYIIAGTSTNAPGSNLLAAENPAYKINSLNCDGSPQSTIAMIDPSGNENHLQQPCFDHPTLFDLLDAKGVSWKYYVPYAGGLWNGPDAIQHIRMGADWGKVITPQTAIFNDIATATLPAVSWVIPTGASSDHALSTDGTGPSWVASIVNAIGNSPYWNSTAIFITWDDWGGWYDHVKPPQYNSYELGFRVPMIVISPYVKTGYVSHVQHEFGSVLHFTEAQFGLGSLGYTDARADDLADCFNFGQAPLAFQTIPAPMRASDFLRRPPSSAPVDTDF